MNRLPDMKLDDLDLMALSRRGQEPVVARAPLYRMMVENAADVMVHADADLRRTYVSPSSREVLGYEPGEMLGKGPYGLVHPDDQQRARATVGRVGPECPCAELTFRMRRKDGSYIWVDGRYRFLPEDGGILAMLRDVTARQDAEDKLAEANAKLEAANRALEMLANQDGLTGLCNRRRFDEVLAEEFRRARRLGLPLSLVMVDVDFFKAYNDLYGHLAGDECLRRISRAVAGAAQRSTDLVARFGGEELVAMMPATDAPGAGIVAERMRQAVLALAIEHRHGIGGLATVSAGLSSAIPAHHEDDPTALLAAADRALYRAKSSGRNRVCSFPRG